MLNVIIDCDTGIDDSLAILFALKRPDVRVLGITTGCGNTTTEQAAENTLRLIQLANPAYAVPVSVGAGAPLSGSWDGPVVDVHGRNGIGDAILPPSPQKPVREAADDFIVRLARENPGQLTLVTLGRLTNLALALRREPSLSRLLRSVVAMGGTIHEPGNVSPVCEANIAGDPEAADAVFMAGFDLTQVGLDVTNRVRLRADHLDKLEKYCAPGCEPIVQYLRDALKLYFNFNRLQDNCLDHCPVHDPLAMLVAVDPSLVTIRKMRARVECGGTFCRGMVVTDLRAHPMDAPFASICVDVDAVRAVEELLAAFTRLN